MQHGYFEIFKYLQETDFDLVHNISQNQTPFFTDQFLKIPTLTTLLHKPKGLLQSAIKLSHAANTYYVAINHDVANSYTGHSKIDEIIYCGIDYNAWSFEAEPQTNIIFFAGNVVAGNYIDKIIEAAADGGFKLMIHGEISDEKYYQKIGIPNLIT